MRRRIGNHAGSQTLLVLLGFRTEIFQIDITILVAFNGYGLIPALDSAGRVGSVGGSRKQNDITMALADAFLISTDHTRPVYSPAAPEFGCNVQPLKPVIVHK